MLHRDTAPHMPAPTTDTEHTVPTPIVGAMAAAFDALGLPATASLARHGLANLPGSTGRAPLRRLMDWSDELAAASGDPDVGVRLGSRLPFGTRPLLDNLFGSAATLGEALAIVERFGRVPTTAAGWERHDEPEGRVVYVMWTAPDLAKQRWNVDFRMARALSHTRHALRQNFRPLEVRLSYPAPASTAALRAFYDAPLSFGHAQDALVLPAALLRCPLPSANPSLNQLLEELAEEELARGGGTPDLLQRLREYVAGSLQPGALTLDAAASALGLGARTLRRRLDERDTSFRRVVQDVRCELARRYLDAGELDLADISFVLGFANVTAFHRAFKRSTGQTASDYRRSGRRR